MKKTSPEDVLHLANLAKLKLSAKEAAKFAPQFDSIMKLFAELSEVDTTGVIETAQTTGLENVWREDKITACKYEKELLECSPHKIVNGQICIPKIL